jgi:hypothetical protein
MFSSGEPLLVAEKMHQNLLVTGYAASCIYFIRGKKIPVLGPLKRVLDCISKSVSNFIKRHYKF